jgi:hypothetical protein
MAIKSAFFKILLCTIVLVLGDHWLHAAEPLKITARLWVYETLCNFQDSQNWPTKESRGAGTSLSAENCEVLIEKWGHPPAVCITIENLDAIQHEIPLNGLSAIKLSGSGKTITALAIRRKSSGGPKYYFTTELVGSWILSVAPKQIVDLIVLFSQAERGAEVTVGTLGTVKIEKGL